MIRSFVITLGALALSVCPQVQAQAGTLTFSGVILEPTCVVQPQAEADADADADAAGEMPAFRLGTDTAPCRPAKVVHEVPAQPDAGPAYVVTYH